VQIQICKIVCMASESYLLVLLRMASSN
jgi:hypothetical protein